MGQDVIEDEDITIKEEKVFAAQTNDLEHDFDSADEDEVDTKWKTVNFNYAPIEMMKKILIFSSSASFSTAQRRNGNSSI